MKLVSPLAPALREVALQYFFNDSRWKDDFSPAMTDDPIDLAHDVAGAFADIDDDGVPEVLFRINDTRWCGTAGCAFVILKKQGEKWREICSTQIQFQHRVKVLRGKDHGYHRILVGYELSREPDILNWPHGKCVNSGLEEG